MNNVISSIINIIIILFFIVFIIGSCLLSINGITELI